MLKFPTRWLALVLLLGAGILIAMPSAVQAEDAATAPAADADAGLARLGKVLIGTKGKLAAAISTAEREGGGIAFGAKVEVEKGRTIYEVFIYVEGEAAKVREVEIDATTGKVLEIEDADGDDDDDEEDENDDDDEEDD